MEIHHLINDRNAAGILKYLEEDADADVNFQDNFRDRLTPLMRLCHGDYRSHDLADILDALFERCPDVNIQDSFGRTALVHACISENLLVAEYLLNSRYCDPDLTDSEGNTALMYAVKVGCLPMVQKLIDSSDTIVQAVNNQGLTAFDISYKLGKHKICEVIKPPEKDTRNLIPRGSHNLQSNTTLPPTYSPQINEKNRRQHLTNRGISDNRGRLDPRTINQTTDSHSAGYTSKENVSSLLHKRQPNAKEAESKGKYFLNKNENLFFPRLNTTDSMGSDSDDAPVRLSRVGRRDSISLPDLRDLNGSLVNFKSSTPNYSGSPSVRSRNDLNIIENNEIEPNDDATPVNYMPSHTRKTTIAAKYPTANLNLNSSFPNQTTRSQRSKIAP